MKWNNGRERAIFNKEQAKLREVYSAAGMTEEQIQELYEFDLQNFRLRRTEALHTQNLQIIEAKPAENGNFGLILKDYAVTVNGKSSNLGMAFYDSSTSDLNYGALTIAEKTNFKVGDKISANVIMLPYGARTKQSNYDSVLKVYEDSVSNPLRITARRGKTLSDGYVPTVVSENDIAEFTVSGGAAGDSQVTYTVKAGGFSKLGRPVMRELVNGTWVTVDIASAVGYDGYSVAYENGKITYSFAITKGAPDRIFKVIIV